MIYIIIDVNLWLNKILDLKDFYEYNILNLIFNKNLSSDFDFIENNNL